MKSYNHPDRINSWLIKVVAETPLSNASKQNIIREMRRLIKVGYLRGDISEELAKQKFLVDGMYLSGKELFLDLYL